MSSTGVEPTAVEARGVPKPASFAVSPTISARSGVRASGVGIAFLRDGFRPFYFGGAIVAALGVPLWLGMWYHQYFTPSLPALYWHMHEMVFGFAAAIIVGFLFTAVRNWTGLPLPAGVPLGVLFALWIVGRVGMFAAYGPATGVLDSSLLVVVAGVLAHKFIRARSWSSMPLLVVLLSLASANIAFHGAMHDLIPVSPMGAVEFGLMLVVLVAIIIGGRVVPGFTANAIPGVRLRRSVWLHRGSFALPAAAFIADGLHLSPWLSGVAALLASATVAAQAIGWNSWAARGRPLLWILHAGYGFIPVGLLLLGLAQFGVVPRSAAVHAFGVGSIGGLIIGMITRTALGHSGRQVRAGRAEVMSYGLVLLGAVLRVSASLIPAAYLGAMLGAGAAWSLAFLIYLGVYAPVLFGRAGPDCPSPTRRCAAMGGGT